jgi:hypothetical protein
VHKLVILIFRLTTLLSVWDFPTFILKETYNFAKLVFIRICRDAFCAKSGGAVSKSVKVAADFF